MMQGKSRKWMFVVFLAISSVGWGQVNTDKASGSAISTSQIEDTREQLLTLLHESPVLREVVATDPSLLADQTYIDRANPQLAAFLTAHPEVMRNPDFYLFADLPSRGGRHSDRIERRTGYEISAAQETAEMHRRSFGNLMQALVLISFVIGLLWLIRIVLENRRWAKVFQVQTEVQSRLMDRFGSSEDLIRYMQSESGKRFLEASPLGIGIETGRRWPGALAKILGPLQLGIVLTLLGVGLLAIRNSLPEMTDPLLVFGVIALMPGLGFILSSGVTWWLSARLGLVASGSENQR